MRKKGIIITVLIGIIVAGFAGVYLTQTGTEYIIGYKDGVDPDEIFQIIDQNGGEDVNHLSSIGAFTATMSSKEAKNLAGAGKIEYVEENQEMSID
ncbi:hypothetical protein [Metabacillus sp. SLBN-84]